MDHLVAIMPCKFIDNAFPLASVGPQHPMGFLIPPYIILDLLAFTCPVRIFSSKFSPSPQPPEHWHCKHMPLCPLLCYFLSTDIYNLSFCLQFPFFHISFRVQAYLCPILQIFFITCHLSKVLLGALKCAMTFLSVATFSLKP